MYCPHDLNQEEEEEVLANSYPESGLSAARPLIYYAALQTKHLENVYSKTAYPQFRNHRF